MRLLLLALLVSAALAAEVTPNSLRCEYRTEPQGVDCLAPRLGWLAQGEGRGLRQTAYRILVASTPGLLEQDHGDRWDSGRVASDAHQQITFAGAPLTSGQRCWWKVRLWDQAGHEGPWSATASWTMGLLEHSDWTAAWIGVDGDTTVLDQPATPRLLRRDFTAAGLIRRATLAVTALGLYEMHVNGHRVGDQVLAPEWTDYRKRVQYQVHDVTTLVQNGANALGASLGNGWYCGPWQHWKKKLMPIYGDRPWLRAQLDLEYADGTTARVTTDAAWHGTTEGPIRLAGIYEGETYDARREAAGWDQPGFDDRAWPAVTVGTPACGKLVWQRSEPIRVTEEVAAVAVMEPIPGIWVVDFGQNLAGWCRLRLRAPAGTTVTLQHNEILNLDGTVCMTNLHAGHLSGGERQIVRYTCRGGDAEEVYEPHFTYQGFRYVQIAGLPEAPSLKTLTARVFHTDMTRTGWFTCSDPRLNRLAENIRWSQRSNTMGVPTDCCQRDERCGYTGDMNFFMPTAVYGYDIAAFASKWLVDVCQDSQMADGHFADHAPTYGPGDGWNVGWSDAGIICPWLQWRTYGDTQVIRDHWDAMERKMALLAQTAQADLHVRPVGNGDWLNLKGGAAPQVIGTAYDAYDARLMADMAAAIGRPADSLIYRQRSERIAAAFALAFIDPEGRLKDSSQTGYALAFTMGLVPEDRRQAMADRFAAEIARFKDHLATGFIGTPRLLPGLHLAGRDDLACRLLLTDTYPSWLFPVRLGATTMWERWNGWTPGKALAHTGMNSFNHFAFGAVGEYLYAGLGGISALEPGYRRVRIAPVIPQGITTADVRYDSAAGTIRSSWSLADDGLTVVVTVPLAATAEVTLPGSGEVREGDLPAAQAPSVRLLRRSATGTVWDVESGTYRFHVAGTVRPGG